MIKQYSQGTLIILLGAFLVGCGSFVPTVNVSNLSEEQKHKIRQVEIFNLSQIQNKQFRVLTIVEGNSWSLGLIH